MKILITGGHLAPALAVIDEIGDNANIVFAGRKFTLDKERSFSLEYQEIAAKKIPFHYLQTGRLTRLLSWKSILEIFKMPFGLYQSLAILLKEKPDTILSFGGYLGFPICLIGFLLKIPVFIHEQTARPGLTNRLTAALAKKIFVSFAETAGYFPAAKTIISGNPVRKSALKINKKPFNFKKNKPVLYITGGSLGSHSINIKVEESLSLILSKYIVIHQTGKAETYDDYQRLSKKRADLPADLKKNYFLREHFFADEVGFIYSLADLVIGRSGANTIFELIAWEKPAVLIPLPWSASNEQLYHAQLFKREHIGEIFDQENPSSDLLNLINKLATNIDDYKMNFKNVKLLYKENAAKIIVKTILADQSV